MKSIFQDKKQEINQIVDYINLISGSDAIWHVTPATFSVTISGFIERTFTKAELEAYEKQIKYLKTITDNDKIDNIDSFNLFLKILNNIRNRWKVCQNDFCSVYNPKYESDQFNYIDALKKIHLKQSEEEEEIEEYLGLPIFTEYFTKDTNVSAKDRFNFGPKNYYSFGESILKYKENEEDQSLLLLFNKFGFAQIDKEIIESFIREDLFSMKSIDPIKIGHKFVDKLSQKNYYVRISYDEFNLKNRLKNKSYAKLFSFIQKFEDLSLLIANVPKPSHTYHLIQPSYVFYVMNKFKKLINCPLENILFCRENENFQDSLERISNSNDRDFYIIVHPENLKSKEMDLLKIFISTIRNENLRPKDYNNKKYSSKKDDSHEFEPKILIISSLPSSFFFLEGSIRYNIEDIMNNINESIIFDEKDISEFATFNAQWRKVISHNYSDLFLFSSSQPGIGKTFRINRIMDSAVRKFKDNGFDEVYNKCHIYIDMTTKEIPESILEYTFIHVSISPELFLNNFLIFDQMYILIQYGFFIFQSGSHITYLNGKNVIPTFLIEIPNLDYSNSFKNFYDFPIAPSNNEIKYIQEDGFKNKDIYDIITEEYKDSDNAYFINGLFYLDPNCNQMKIENENLIQLMRLIFDDSYAIDNYMELIKKSKLLFFKDESYINDNHIISKVKKMIDDYSDLIISQYEDDEEMKRLLFLLSIRTVLYIWHFTPETYHSIILLVPQRLMTLYAFDPKNDWIFIGFNSKRDNNQKWNNTVFGIDSDFSFIQKLYNKFNEINNNQKYNDKFYILTDIDNSRSDGISLHIRFIKAILFFLPYIDLSSSSNPFNAALILSSLFSDSKHFPFDNAFRMIIKDLSNNNLSIENIQRKYKAKNIEWTELDELLANYLRDKNGFSADGINSIKDIIHLLKDDLSKHENIYNIIKISFTKKYFAIFVEIILKIYYQHYTILQGDTGCGKTSIVHLLNDIISIAKSDESTKYDINWNFFMIDFHSNYSREHFDKEIESIKIDMNLNYREKYSRLKNERLIVFLDEFNTSPSYYYVINYIQNSTSRIFSYICAINEYILIDPITYKLSCVGIPQNINRQMSCIKMFQHPDEDIKELSAEFDANGYAYNVKEPPESIKSSIINTNTQEFDEENPKNGKYLPDEERSCINFIINKILLQWKNNSFIDLPSTIYLISKLISNIFITVRSFLHFRMIFSYRDVYRCITIFTYIFDYFKKKLSPKVTQKDDIWNKITSISVVIAVYISLICRFSHQEIEVNDSIRERFKDHPFEDQLNSPKINMYDLLLNYVSDEINWPHVDLPYIKNWEQLSILFAYAKCMKYIIYEDSLIYPLPSLMLNLLILSLTVSLSFKDINTNKKINASFNNSEFFTCLIIGMPGTSKSKAVEIFKKYHLKSFKKDKKKRQHFITTYLYSRTSDSDSLLSQFLNCAWFLNERSNYQTTKTKKAIIVLDNIGLANYNHSSQLTLLHHLSDKGVLIKNERRLPEYCKIIPIQLSNYQIDFSNMNRGFLVCSEIPTDIEFSSFIALGEILNKYQEQIREDLSKNILKSITQLNTDDINDYEDILLNDIFCGQKSIEIGEKSKDDENSESEEYFDFDELKEFHQELKVFYKKLVQSLWNITQDNHQKPSFYSMRSFFNLISTVTKLKEIIENPYKNKKKIKKQVGKQTQIYKNLAFILN